VKPFVPFQTGGYRITPLKADHDPGSSPVIYIIEADGVKGAAGRSLLYANDTGYFPDETWAYLADVLSGRFDLVSLDCTTGAKECRRGHMGLDTCAEVRERLISMDMANRDGTIFCLNHFSHNGTLIYDEMAPVAAKAGFQVAYDGMKIQV
jgi:phosphoribosyl 1,2-cyclic phosphate phosphodiesterase